MLAETAMTMPLAVEIARPSPRAHLVRPMKATLRLDVSHSSGSAGTFDIRLGDRLVCTSETPLLTAARVLLAEGVDPNTILEMFWPGRDDWALRGSVRRLARLTVRHGRFGTPVFAQFVEPRKEPS
jgi:hypothetical protein